MHSIDLCQRLYFCTLYFCLVWKITHNELEGEKDFKYKISLTTQYNKNYSYPWTRRVVYFNLPFYLIDIFYKTNISFETHRIRYVDTENVCACISIVCIMYEITGSSWTTKTY